MRVTWVIGLFALMGCATVQSPISSSSEEALTASAHGLWVLDDVAEDGDIELLQLATEGYAGLIRVEPPAVMAEAAAGAAPVEAARAATGSLVQSGAASALEVESPGGEMPDLFAVSAAPDKLMLTTPDGRVLTYRRTYGLWCVPTDRGLEATMLLALGQQTKLIGVNGDGRIFPNAGTRAATIDTAALFSDEQEYVVVAPLAAGTATVRLPWKSMTRTEIVGTVTISGVPDPAGPTSIACEKVALP